MTRQAEDGNFYHVTNHNFPSDWVEYTKAIPLRPGRGTTVGRALLEKKAVQIPDVLADPEYTQREAQKKAAFRTFLGVPLLREGQPIGVLSLCRRTVEPFTEKQIELVSSFADQAVIAIENVRLFDEVNQRTDDLRESLEYQTAISSVLGVISRRHRIFNRSGHDRRDCPTPVKSEHAYIMRLQDGKYYLAAAKDARPNGSNFSRKIRLPQSGIYCGSCRIGTSAGSHFGCPGRQRIHPKHGRRPRLSHHSRRAHAARWRSDWRDHPDARRFGALYRAADRIGLDLCGSGADSNRECAAVR